MVETLRVGKDHLTKNGKDNSADYHRAIFVPSGTNPLAGVFAVPFLGGLL